MISKQYVPEWTVKDALRELLQNSLDAGLIAYTSTHINNQGALELKHLLLGCTAKAGDDTKLGQFGEGLKIALLVLLRNGITATIHTDTYDITPVWREQYGEEVLDFEIVETVRADNTTTVHFSQEVDWDGIYMPGEPGVLLDCQKLYVGGLYMCDLKGFKFGYNLAPGSIAINRDRKQVSEYDVAYAAAPLLVSTLTDSEIADLICDPDINDSTYLYLKANANVKGIVAQRYSSLGRPNRSVLPFAMKEVLKTAAPEKSQNYKAAQEFYDKNKKHMRRAAKVDFLKLLEKL